MPGQYNVTQNNQMRLYKSLLQIKHKKIVFSCSLAIEDYGSVFQAKMSENTNEINNNNHNNNNSSPKPGTSKNNNKWPQKTNRVKCDICNVFLTSDKLLEIHLMGKKHNIIAQKLKDREWSYTCHVCDVHTNGRQQYAEHIAGKIHKSRIEELKGCEDLNFFFMYTAVATLLLFIFVYYLFYFMFLYIN